MNAAQRRKQRRARGLRGPWTCVWCGTSNHAISPCSGCGARLKPVGDVTLRELARKAHARGLKVEFRIAEPDGVPTVSILARAVDAIAKVADLAKR